LRTPAKENDPVREKKPTRRQFAKKVAALAAAPAVASAATAQEPAPPERTAGQALAEVVRLRYGMHLNADQLRRVTQRIENNQRMADRLKRITLQNGEEPAFQFSPDVF
jgi:hypothetical protein